MSHSPVQAIFATLVICLASLSYSQAQTQASCTFNIFQAPGLVNGVNDFRTTVGQSRSNPARGFIRYSGGGVSYFTAPNATSTNFTGRNDAGVSVGFYNTQGTSIPKGGFILQGSKYTPFTHPKAVLGTVLSGINKFNSSVGFYFDSAQHEHGFKRYSNGGLTSLNYPGALDTAPLAINDSGTVVGTFVGSGSDGSSHGFLYHGGSWAQIDDTRGDPGNTELVGISNANVIVGFFQLLDNYISFLYTNGVFKNIEVPNADATQVTDISAKGIISGNAQYDDGSIKEFTATCK
ncbi:MAG TPA: hypothetical protein VJ731_00990 [Terriglobales bacterium]|nr:hypothetical protein [Terriglobales bacterium]